jgi:universal stress protein A
MKRISKILVPVDFSIHSEEALGFAADLSRRYDASLELLHVFHVTTYALPGGYVVPDGDQLTLILTDLQARLAAVKRTVLANGPLKVETTLIEGGVATEILRFAKERECDLIVMGTHGRTGMQHLLIGSIAEHIVRTAPCPVLTWRAPT